jgi:hypothetical protein
MTKTKQMILLILVFLVASCASQMEKNDFEHNYVKYWDKYPAQQLIDTLFSDTLLVGPTTEGGWKTREFYINTTKELIADLRDDQKIIDSLYPMTDFDELTIKNLPHGLKNTFTKEQTVKFLQIINDPVSFNWSETTYEPEYCVEFWKNEEVVATLTIGADNTIIKTEPGWPLFKKMKLGQLKTARQSELTMILNEVKKQAAVFVKSRLK